MIRAAQIACEYVLKALPRGCAGGWADPRLTYALLASEINPGLTPKRQAEFSAGRMAAHQALAQIGMAGVGVPQAGDRTPIWPPGVVGSISHSDQICLAVCTRGLHALGVDVEPAQPLADGVAKLVVGPRDLVEGWPSALMSLVIFCAKEACYKAQYPLSGVFLEFCDVEVRVSGAVFEAQFAQPVAGIGAGVIMQGRIGMAVGHILAVAWLDR